MLGLACVHQFVPYKMEITHPTYTTKSPKGNEYQYIDISIADSIITRTIICVYCGLVIDLATHEEINETSGQTNK